MKLSVVILAAGHGTRMRSKLPKALHTIAGKPMLAHVIDTAKQLTTEKNIHIVYGHDGERIQQTINNPNLHWVFQARPEGTGRAVATTLPGIPDDHRVLVLFSDVPLISKETLSTLLDNNDNDLSLVFTQLDDPSFLGRIVRDANGQITSIIEHKDATVQQKEIRDVFSGILCAPAVHLKNWLNTINNDNAQQEYYLTSIIPLAAKDGLHINATRAHSHEEVQGVNTPAELIRQERFYQKTQAERLLNDGVKIMDPTRFDLRGTLDCGQDVTLDINVIIEGKVSLGDHVVIGPNTILRNCHIGDGTHIKENCVIDGAMLAPHCVVGPFARLRPDTHLSEGVHIGNFVEIKNSQLGTNSKANHLSYIGDTTMGNAVNFGAGAITCNYDGAQKHKTAIGNDVFVGSNTQLVAPVTIGNNATIGAGATITKNVPADQLTFCKKHQQSVEHWVRPLASEITEEE